jgi:hypothetical protein
MPEPPAPHPAEPPGAGADLRAVIDEELARLPEKLRIAVVLCDIEGRTREEAAAQLGVPVGTLSGRLTTAHRKLAGLLERRGVASAVVALGALAPSQLTAGVPAPLAATTAAGVPAATNGLTASGVSHRAVELALAVVRAMRSARWKAPILLLIGGVVLGPGIVLAIPADPPGATEQALAPVEVPVPEPAPGGRGADTPRTDAESTHTIKIREKQVGETYEVAHTVTTSELVSQGNGKGKEPTTSVEKTTSKSVFVEEVAAVDGAMMTKGKRTYSAAEGAQFGKTVPLGFAGKTVLFERTGPGTRSPSPTASPWPPVWTRTLCNASSSGFALRASPSSFRTRP